MEELRTCTKCSSLLSLSLFRKDRQYVTYTCQACHLAFLKNYRELHKEKITTQKDQWYLTNKEYVLERRKNTIQLKLANALRVRLNGALKKNSKRGSAVKDLDCSIEELKLHLESKFLPGMSWHNWTKDGWHIDHIRPLSSFDLTNADQFKEACHYNNLQPLWAKDNLSKGGV